MTTLDFTTSLPDFNSSGNGSFYNGADANMGKTELYFLIAMLSFFCFMGTVGNIIVLYVFSQRKDKLTSTVFILALAVVDLFTCMVPIPWTIYMEYKNYYVPNVIICKTYMFFITSNVPCSALIMVSIAIDRYFCICHPFWHAMTIFRAKALVVVMSLIASGIGAITSVCHGLTQDGLCTIVDNYKIFITYYQKCYSSLYLLCLIIVLVLYLFIYRSVISRRTKRAKQKSRALPLIQLQAKKCTVGEILIETEVTVLSTAKQNGDHTSVDNDSGKNLLSNAHTEHHVMENGDNISPKKKKQEQKKREKLEKKKENQINKKDNLAMANLKTAAMLFVVTVVFVVTYCPALLMSMQFLPYSTIIFYMYYANNVINPVIYSFMNQNFRDDLKKIFCSKR